MQLLTGTYLVVDGRLWLKQIWNLHFQSQKIKLDKIEHRGQIRISVAFPFHPENIEKIKQIPAKKADDLITFYAWVTEITDENDELRSEFP